MKKTTTMNLLPERTIAIPPWVHPRVRDRIAGKRHVLRITPGVRSRLRCREKIAPSNWNENYRVMPSAETHPGRWRRDIAPHAAWIMDLWALPSVREVWLCGPDQASKTSSMIGCIGWVADRDPGNVFYTASTEDKTKEIFDEKLTGMFRESPVLAKLMSTRSDDTGLKRMRLNNGMTIRIAWSNSPASTASFGARYTFNDEVDKWRRVGKETSPVRRIRKRSKNYPLTHKHFWSSTPAGEYIYTGMMACQQIWTHAARCPECNELVVMDEEHMHIPDGSTEETIKAAPTSVMYSCNACGCLWDEEMRLMAYRNGDKVCIKGADILEPVDIGVHLTGFVTPDMRMADIARTILAAKGGDLDAKIDLAHGIKCIDFAEELSDRKEDAILLLRDDRPEGLVPSVPIAAVTAVADMQKRGFWYKITAWGYGLEQESWTLKNGYVDSWEALRLLFYETEFQDVAGNTYVINLRGMDSGGGESEQWADLSRTAEAYLFACKNPGMLLFKGQKRMSKPFTVTDLDRLPGTNKPLPGSIKLYNLNSRHFKDRLAAKLMVDPTDPGAWHLHKDTDLDFARQMCAEGKDDAGFWTCPKGKANHYWDCSYMEMALVEIAQVKLWRRPDEQQAIQRRIISKGVNRSD